MAVLGVNVDHVATLRQARGEGFPCPVAAAVICEKAGADSIVAHLREDRRHIQDADIFELKHKLTVRLNLEMSMSESVVEVANEVCPDQITLVPENRQEKTTESGLDVISNSKRIESLVSAFRNKSIEVSLFVDPAPDQIVRSKELGADAIEIHTGDYANAGPETVKNELNRIAAAVRQGRELGMEVNVGHGLNYSNVSRIAEIDGINEFNIGFSIIAKSIEIGLNASVKNMLQLISPKV